MATRRDFLKGASMMALGAFAASKLNAAETVNAVDGTTAATAGAKNLGIQAYSLGGELFADPAGALKKLKSYGYQQMELAFYGNGGLASWGRDSKPIPAKDFKKMADDAGIKIASSHLTPNNLERGASMTEHRG